MSFTFKVGDARIVSHKYNDANDTFGVKDCLYIIKKELFSLTPPDSEINTYSIF